MNDAVGANLMEFGLMLQGPFPMWPANDADASSGHHPAVVGGQCIAPVGQRDLDTAYCQLQTEKGEVAVCVAYRVTHERYPGSASVFVGIEHVHVEQGYQWVDLAGAFGEAIACDVQACVVRHRVCGIVRVYVSGLVGSIPERRVLHAVTEHLLAWGRRRAGVRVIASDPGAGIRVRAG